MLTLQELYDKYSGDPEYFTVVWQDGVTRELLGIEVYSK